MIPLSGLCHINSAIIRSRLRYRIGFWRGAGLVSGCAAGGVSCCGFVAGISVPESAAVSLLEFEVLSGASLRSSALFAMLAVSCSSGSAVSGVVSGDSAGSGVSTIVGGSFVSGTSEVVVSVGAIITASRKKANITNAFNFPANRSFAARKFITDGIGSAQIAMNASKILAKEGKNTIALNPIKTTTAQRKIVEIFLGGLSFCGGVVPDEETRLLEEPTALLLPLDDAPPSFVE